MSIVKHIRPERKLTGEFSESELITFTSTIQGQTLLELNPMKCVVVSQMLMVTDGLMLEQILAKVTLAVH